MSLSTRTATYSALGAQEQQRILVAAIIYLSVNPLEYNNAEEILKSGTEFSLDDKPLRDIFNLLALINQVATMLIHNGVALENVMILVSRGLEGSSDDLSKSLVHAICVVYFSEIQRSIDNAPLVTADHLQQISLLLNEIHSREQNASIIPYLGLACSLQRKKSHEEALLFSARIKEMIIKKENISAIFELFDKDVLEIYSVLALALQSFTKRGTTLPFVYKDFSLEERYGVLSIDFESVLLQATLAVIASPVNRPLNQVCALTAFQLISKAHYEQVQFCTPATLKKLEHNAQFYLANRLSGGRLEQVISSALQRKKDSLMHVKTGLANALSQLDKNTPEVYTQIDAYYNHLHDHVIGQIETAYKFARIKANHKAYQKFQMAIGVAVATMFIAPYLSSLIMAEMAAEGAVVASATTGVAVGVSSATAATISAVTQVCVSTILNSIVNNDFHNLSKNLLQNIAVVCAGDFAKSLLTSGSVMLQPGSFDAIKIAAAGNAARGIMQTCFSGGKIGSAGLIGALGGAIEETAVSTLSTSITMTSSLDAGVRAGIHGSLDALRNHENPLREGINQALTAFIVTISAEHISDALMRGFSRIKSALPDDPKKNATEEPRVAIRRREEESDEPERDEAEMPRVAIRRREEESETVAEEEHQLPKRVPEHSVTLPEKSKTDNKPSSKKSEKFFQPLKEAKEENQDELHIKFEGTVGGSGVNYRAINNRGTTHLQDMNNRNKFTKRSQLKSRKSAPTSVTTAEIEHSETYEFYGNEVTIKDTHELNTKRVAAGYKAELKKIKVNDTVYDLEHAGDEYTFKSAPVDVRPSLVTSAEIGVEIEDHKFHIGGIIHGPSIEVTPNIPGVCIGENMVKPKVKLTVNARLGGAIDLDVSKNNPSFFVGGGIGIGYGVTVGAEVTEGAPMCRKTR